MTVSSPSVESRFDRGVWFTLAGNLLLVAAGLAILWFRYSVPTDGWWVDVPDGPDQTVVTFARNLVGAPSGLQAGDHLLAVEGVPVDELETRAPAWQAWQAGGTVRYTVERSGTPVTVDVPLVHWTPQGMWELARWRPEQITTLLGDSLFLAVALFVFFRRPNVKAARALLALAAFLLMSSTSTEVLPTGVADEIYLPLAIAELFVIVALYTVLGPPALLRFALVFPQPKAAVLRRPWLEWAPYAAGVLMVPAFVLTGGGAGWAWTAGAVLGAVGLLIHSALTLRDPVSQAQLRWAVGGLTAGLGLVLLGYPAEFGWVRGRAASLLDDLAGVTSVIMGLSLAVAILRYRLFDIDLIIRRTLIYAALSAVLAAVYFGSVVLLQTLFRGLTGGVAQSQLAIVASTLAIAALFNPVRRRVQDFIDRRFFRRKYDAAHTLAAFAATARDETDLDRLTGRLVGVVTETVQPASVDLWLRRPEKRK